MSAGLSENELSDSNGLFPTTKTKFILLKSKVIPLRTKNMISVFWQLLRWGLIRSNTSRQMANRGRKVP